MTETQIVQKLLERGCAIDRYGSSDSCFVYKFKVWIFSAKTTTSGKSKINFFRIFSSMPWFDGQQMNIVSLDLAAAKRRRKMTNLALIGLSKYHETAAVSSGNRFYQLFHRTFKFSGRHFHKNLREISTPNPSGTFQPLFPRSFSHCSGAIPAENPLFKDPWHPKKISIKEHFWQQFDL